LLVLLSYWRAWTTSVRDLDTRQLLGSGPLTLLHDEALAFASEHHRGQLRKRSRLPYLCTS